MKIIHLLPKHGPRNTVTRDRAQYTYVQCVINKSVCSGRTHCEDCPEGRRELCINLSSKQTLDVATVHRGENIKPPLRISDEKAASLCVTQTTPLSGQRLDASGICQLQPVGSVLLDIFQNRTNFPPVSSFGSCQRKYS